MLEAACSSVRDLQCSVSMKREVVFLTWKTMQRKALKRLPSVKMKHIKYLFVPKWHICVQVCMRACGIMICKAFNQQDIFLDHRVTEDWQPNKRDTLSGISQPFFHSLIKINLNFVWYIDLTRSKKNKQQQKKKPITFYSILTVSFLLQGEAASVILCVAGQTPETTEDKKNIPGG